MPKLRGTPLLIVALAAALVARAQTPPPQTIYVNGNVYTLSERRPRAEAIGVAGGRIVAVGSNAEVRRTMQPETRVRDLEGRTVLPGLIDAHGHVASLGSFGLGRLDLSAARSYEEVVQIVAERAKAAEPGEWIVGGRWDHESWPQRKLPTHEPLSAATPDNPVWITRVDGHAGLANARAMQLAGITRDTTPPAGGDIIRDEHGDPTGIFVDNAEDLIAQRVKAASADTAALIRKAQEMCLAVGLTGVHDAGITPAEVEVYRRLANAGELKLRIYAMVAGRYAVGYFRENGVLVGDRLTVRSCKLYADGALGSRGAWLLAPYSDRPTDADGEPYTGLAVMNPEFLRTVSEDGLERGYQVCTHAIGDRGNRETLNAYALALSRRPRPDHRFRVEHAQMLSLDDIPRFAKLGVIPSMQPTHCTSDMRWVYDRVGRTRARGAYAWAKLLRAGARIAAGSDFPVESHNPFLGLYAAIARETVEGKPEGGWQPEDRMTREEALRAFTVDAAYAAFEEDRKGSLEVGKLADFIVLDRDVMTCDASAIPGTRVLQTIIGGEVAYSAE